MNIIKVVNLLHAVWSATNGKKTVFGAVIAVGGAVLVFFGYATEAAELEEIGRTVVESGLYVQIVGLANKLIVIAVDAYRIKQGEISE